MPDNKRHHYVPRFYLKRFSPDEKYISLYNIKRRKTIPGAKLYEQCAKNYFYGETPEMEKVLASAEGEIAELYRQIDKFRLPPPPLSPMHEAFLISVLMQVSRTPRSVDALNEAMDKNMKLIYTEHIKKKLGIDLSKFKISHRNPAVYAIGIAMQAYPVMYDLGLKLLLNKTTEPFVLGDHPVVLYNQLLSFNTFGSNCGYASKGQQIFVPLDSQKTMMLFDMDAYRVGSDSKPTHDVTNPRDVYELNTLQMCAAGDNVYFKSPGFNATALHRKAEEFMKAENVEVEAYPQPDEEGKTNVRLIRTSQIDIRTNLSLSFVSIRGSAKRWREEVRAMKHRPVVFIRNKKLVELWEQFNKLCRMGTYNISQFRQFINDRTEADKAGQ